MSETKTIDIYYNNQLVNRVPVYAIATIGQIKSYLQNDLYKQLGLPTSVKAEFYLNLNTKFDVLSTDKFDKLKLKEYWNQMTQPHIVLTIQKQQKQNNNNKKYKYGFTGMKDVDRLILLELDDQSLSQSCKTSKYIRQICGDVWATKFKQLFGSEFSNQIWNLLTAPTPELKYKQAVSALEEFVEDYPELKFLKTVSYEVGEDVKFFTESRDIGDFSQIELFEQIGYLNYQPFKGQGTITIGFPVDYENESIKIFKTFSDEITLKGIMDDISDHYKAKVSVEDFKSFKEQGLEACEWWPLEEAAQGKIQYDDLFGGVKFFEGLWKNPREKNLYIVRFGS